MAARLTTFLVVAIVAATLIAGLIVGAQRGDSDGPVDLIVHNARVYTATEQGAMAQAVAVRGNQILRVGSDREITALKRPQTTTIDARGAAVLPGFNDAHVELIDGGAALDRINLLGAATADEIADRIRDWADGNPDRAWVIGRGWRRDVFGDSAPTRQMLDRLVPDRPAWILDAAGRTAWVNTRALEMANLLGAGGGAAVDRRGREARLRETGGLLEGQAFSKVAALVPRLSPSERERALRAAVSEAHRVGITSVHDVHGSLEALAAYADARRAGDLRLRIYSALPVVRDMSDDELDQLQAALAKYADDPLFKAGAMSLTLDDAASTNQAVMVDTASSSASPSMPAPHFAVDPFNRLVRRLDARGWQVLTRAGGDLAVRMALDAYEHAARSNPTRTQSRRHRIEGPLAVSDSDLVRFEKFAVLASVRPFQSPRMEGMKSRSPSGATGGPAALVRRVSNARGRVAFGSGWPAAPLDPLLGLASMTERREDSPAGAPGLSLKLAIDAYTAGSAWASFDEQRKGSIAPGMLADLVVLSSDIFDGAAANVAAASVDVTIFDGKVVYRRGQRATN